MLTSLLFVQNNTQRCTQFSPGIFWRQQPLPKATSRPGVWLWGQRSWNWKQQPQWKPEEGYVARDTNTHVSHADGSSTGTWNEFPVPSSQTCTPQLLWDHSLMPCERWTCRRLISPRRWEPPPRWGFGPGRLSPASFALLTVPLQENDH